MNKSLKNIFLASFFILSFIPKSFAAITIPNPSTIVDGLPVAIPYDDFFSYSTQLLTQFGYSGFNVPAGVGGLDVVLLTNAGGINNNPVAGGFTFENPQPSATGATSSFSGTWGAGNAANHGPVLVDTLLGYLHNQFGANHNIPVFTFDLAEPGAANSRDLQLVAKFSVYDPVNHAEVDSWALDGVNNGVFDPAAFITVHGEISLTGLSSTVYTASNTGSGKYDFLVYSPLMDLSQYSGHGYEFHIFSEMKDLDGSKEESFISGAFTTPDDPGPGPTPVPEPTTLSLFALGSLALGFSRRFKKQ